MKDSRRFIEFVKWEKKIMGMNLGGVKVKGGSGGKRGHSGMCHWMPTEQVKVVSKKARRREDKCLVKPSAE